jgi:beta-galactosidase/beta-glucuronidase
MEGLPRRACRFRALAALAAVALAATNCGAPPAEPDAGPTPEPTFAPAGDVMAVESSTLPLSGTWCFAADSGGVGENEGWMEPGFDDSSWLSVEVPHTWNVMANYIDYEGIGWYRRTFTLPAEAADAHLRLRFEAVFYTARVWLNGEYLGEHEGGYTPFEFDVTGIAEPGAENIIAVRVDNNRATDRIPAILRGGWSYDWWNYGGIVRNVALEITSQAYIAHQQIVAVPNLTEWDEADAAAVTTTVTIINTAASSLEGTLTADILDDVTGESVLQDLPSALVSLAPGESTGVTLAATIPAPRLWHFDHPNLYRWSAALSNAGGEVLHTAEETFGVRLIELRDAQFFLNGEPVRLVGLTRHADSPEFGLAETVTVMTADYDDMRRLNMVFSRPVHYPQDDFILDYCDRNGILLIPEIPAWQLSAQQMADPDMLALAQQQLGEMIAADFNHPSVWAWSVGNEFESETQDGHDYVQAMVDLAHELDPTRPVGFASNRLYSNPQRDATDLSDFVLMNQYFGTWGGPRGNLSQGLDWIHNTWPDRVVIISEYGFEPRWNALVGVPSASLDSEDYYFIPDDVPSDSEEADEQRRHVITDQMAVYRSRPFVAGAIFWTYQDYRTRTDFVMGVVDIERNRRGSWHVLREEYSPVLFDTVAFSAASEGSQSAAVSLRARGPVETDMPVYTLRGYTLHWAVMSPDGYQTFSEGDMPLPTLTPAETWSGEVAWDVPDTDYVITLSVIRPTGFSVIDRMYDPRGELLPAAEGG